MNSPTTMVAAFRRKAQESLASAGNEYVSGRYNVCMNRCYYSCFQAAVAALIQAGIAPRGATVGWGHSFVQAQFSGVLVNRRHLYAAGLRDVLVRLASLRRTADYEPNDVSEVQAARGLRRAEEFVRAVIAGGDDPG